MYSNTIITKCIQLQFYNNVEFWSYSIAIVVRVSRVITLLTIRAYPTCYAHTFMHPSVIL